MKLSQAPSSLLALLLAALPPSVNAGPFPKDALHAIGFDFLMPRQCIGYCGTDNQYCCSAGQGCYTTANIAFCSASATGAGDQVATGAGYEVYTFTYTETDLVYRTVTTTSWWAAPTTTWQPQETIVGGAPMICTIQGQTSCGKICCAENQMCSGGVCVERPDSSYFPMPTTGTYSAPFRPTSGATSTATSVVSATTTAPFLAPATASGSAFPTPIASEGGGGLSPGAIAGIVIGVIAGIILLLLICFCCIVKAGFDGLLAIFGLGKKRRRSTERIETVEHYSRHGSGTGSRREHQGWFGGPARVDSSRKKKSSGFGGLGAVGAGLAGLAAMLALKRKSDKEKRPRSDVSSSYYSYTDTSASSASSDRRTRDSRRHR